MSQYNHCIVTGAVVWLGIVLQHGAVGLQGERVAIHQVYCDRRGLGLEDCVAIHSVVL